MVVRREEGGCEGGMVGGGGWSHGKHTQEFILCTANNLSYMYMSRYTCIRGCQTYSP